MNFIKKKTVISLDKNEGALKMWTDTLPKMSLIIATPDIKTDLPVEKGIDAFFVGVHSCVCSLE